MRLCHSDIYNTTQAIIYEVQTLPKFQQSRDKFFQKKKTSVIYFYKEMVGQLRLAGIKTLACFKLVFTQIYEHTELSG